MSIQKKIRDLERTLKKKSIEDVDAIEVIKLKIQNLKVQKLANVQKEKEKKNAVKYHMVKFFERKKLTRKIRGIDSKIKMTENRKELKKLNKERDRIKEDLAYVLYYPKSLKYVALFANNDTADCDERSVSTAVQVKARELALEAWRQSVEDEAATDRVQEAIDVEYTKPLKGLTPKGKNGLKSSVAPEDGDDVEEVEGGDSPKVLADESDMSDADSGASNSDDDDDDFVAAAGARPTSDKKGKQKEHESAAGQKSRSSSNIAKEKSNSVSKATANKFAPDSFFVEEIGAEEEEDATTSDHFRLTSRGGRSYRGGFGRGRGRGGPRAIDTSNLSKQESRLIAWQHGKRGSGGRHSSSRGGGDKLLGRGQQQGGDREVGYASRQNRFVDNARGNNSASGTFSTSSAPPMKRKFDNTNARNVVQNKKIKFEE